MKGGRNGCRWSSGRCHVGRTIWKTLLTIKGFFWFFQENLQHIPRAPVRQLWKESLYSPVGFRFGMFQRCVETTLEFWFVGGRDSITLLEGNIFSWYISIYKRYILPIGWLYTALPTTLYNLKNPLTPWIFRDFSRSPPRKAWNLWVAGGAWRARGLPGSSMKNGGRTPTYWAICYLD